MCNTNKQICYAPLYVKQQEKQRQGKNGKSQGGQGLNMRLSQVAGKQNYKILCWTGQGSSNYVFWPLVLGIFCESAGVVTAYVKW